MLQRLIGPRPLRDHPDGVLTAWKKESVLMLNINLVNTFSIVTFVLGEWKRLMKVLWIFTRDYA